MLRDSVGVEDKHISAAKMAFPDQAIPFLEKPEYGAGRIESHQSVVAAQQESGQMSAVRIAQTLRLVVIFAKEKSGVGAVGGIVIE